MSAAWTKRRRRKGRKIREGEEEKEGEEPGDKKWSNKREEK
jgi:hypothetical protein